MNVCRILLIAAVLFSQSATAWWNCGWANRMPLAISKPAGAPLTNAQVLLRLSSTNVPASFNWGNNGDGLRAVDQDDLTALDIFIESWNATAQTARVWVRVPTISGGGRTIYLYFNAPPGTPSASTPLTFTEPGLKFHTRRSTVDPTNRATAEAAWAAANNNTAGYGCAIITNYTGITNQSLFSPPSRNGEFGLFAEVFFEVAPGQAGLWEFRYGADFGRGGGLYVDEIALDEKWNVDLWWADNWANTSQILAGSINLAPGTHSLRILGFEGCCDGGLTAQFRRPGGAWLALSLANINLRSNSCLAVDPTVAYGPGAGSTCPIVGITRGTQAFSDPFNTAPNSKRIPGGIILNTTNISNSGQDPVDANSVVITEAIPANMALRIVNFDGSNPGPVSFVNGTPASGLSYNFIALNNNSDSLSFSSDGGATWLYSPTPDGNGVDLNITHFRIRPGGSLLGNSGSGAPNAQFRFKTLVR